MRRHALETELKPRQLTCFALEWVFPDLPAGVTAKPEAIPASTGPAKITFQAPATAAAFQGPFHIGLKQTGSTAAPKPVVRTWQNEESRGDYLINTTPDFWMTVIAVPPPKPPPAESAPKPQ